MRITERKIEILTVAEFRRGSITESQDGFHTLHIRALPDDYDYGNWTSNDLQDLRDALDAFLKVAQR